MKKKTIYLTVLVCGLSLFASSNECSMKTKSLACKKIVQARETSTSWTADDVEEITPPIHFLLCHL